jgi:hypothetical protein
MSTLEQAAAQMGEMSEAIIRAIGRLPGHDNTHVIMGSLGSVAGCMAQASGDPVKAIDLMARTAQGVVSGELLD